jgi:SAM-dependent methyltransferase
MARWTHPVSASRILETIDEEKLKRLRERYPHRPDSPKINRFEDAREWVGVNLERAQDLWLDRSPPLRILDLGCGSGFFLYICQLFGHEVVGIDRDTNPLFRGTTDLLKVRRVVAEIDPGFPLPDLGQKFDLITAYRICFQRLGRLDNGGWKEWSPKEWEFFLNDIRSRFLSPNGRLLLAFNPRPDGTYFDPDVRSYFESQGACFFRSKVLFATNPKAKARFKDVKAQG